MIIFGTDADISSFRYGAYFKRKIKISVHAAAGVASYLFHHPLQNVPIFAEQVYPHDLAFA